MSLLMLESGGLTRAALLAHARTVDVAAIQALLARRLPDTEAGQTTAPLLFATAAQAYEAGAIGTALAYVRRLMRRMASERALLIAEALPKGAPGWIYDSGGLGGWPAGVSKTFRREPRDQGRVHVGVTEAKQEELSRVKAKLADPTTLGKDESLSSLGGRRALMKHDAAASGWLLRAPIANGTAIAWARTWDIEERDVASLFGALVDVAVLERALRR